MFNRAVTFQSQNYQTLSEQFWKFAGKQCHGESPLYENLCLKIAEDKEILHLALHTRQGQPAPNMLLGAVQYLLLTKELNHPLAGFYYINRDNYDTASGEGLYPCFRSFCLDHGHEIQTLVSTKVVQTNEVSRCASFLPALLLGQTWNEHRPFHFIDAGASAGLCLLWEEYKYIYQPIGYCGTSDSSVQIECEVRGQIRFQLQTLLPHATTCLGIEWIPIDLENTDEIQWLRSLIWPEHKKRREVFDKSIQLAQRNKPQIVNGDVLQILPELCNTHSDGCAIYVLFSFSGYQIFPDGRATLGDFFSKLSENRNIFEISIGNFGHEIPRIILAEYNQGKSRREQTVALCDTYGRWIQLLPGEA